MIAVLEWELLAFTRIIDLTKQQQWRVGIAQEYCPFTISS